MAVLKTTDWHENMKRMNEFRHEKKFCDVCIIFDDHKIHAHKCILAAGSDYFKCLFGGSFQESATAEVDLSEIVTDKEHIEMVVNYLYVGEINVNRENLYEFIKLSSYLMISKLKHLLSNHMVESVCVENCLKYFLASIIHVLPEVEEKSFLVIKVRFHDHVIFQQDALDLQDTQILHFIEEGALRFCSVPNILRFLTNWLAKDTTDNIISVGNRVLDCCKLRQMELNSLSGHDAVAHCNDVRAAFDEITNKLQAANSPAAENFMDSMRNLMTHFPEIEKDDSAHTCRENLNQDPAAMNLDRIFQNDTERVVIAVRPRSSFKYFVTVFTAPPERCAEHDVYVYVPRLRSWFFLQTLEMTISYEINETDYWVYRYVPDQLLCLCPYSLYSYNLHNSIWTDLKPHDYWSTAMLIEDETFSSGFDHEFIFSADGESYFLKAVFQGTSEARQANCVCYHCYKMKPDGTWGFLFWTPAISTDRKQHYTFSRISSVSHEMLINVLKTSKCYRSGNRETVYELVWSLVVDLKAPRLTCTKVYPKQGHLSLHGQIDNFWRFNVLEGKDRFYIIMRVTENEGHLELKPKYQYVFHSNTLSAYNEEPVTVQDFGVDLKRDHYPFTYRAHAEDLVSRSMWIFGGNRAGANTLQEVKVDDTGKLTLRHHTPPPFECVNSLFAGTISSDILKKGKLVEKYVTNNEDEDVPPELEQYL